MNAAFLTEPVRDDADLRRRIDDAAAHFRRDRLPWVFIPAEDQLPPALAARLSDIAAGAGLQHMMPMTGMVATTPPPPTRALPRLDLHPVSDEPTRRAVADVNADGYDMPRDLLRTALVGAELWTEMLGVVGYDDDEPVTTASVLPIDATAYVCLVATRPAYQGQRYAEAALRRALADAHGAWGIERTVLHATPAGWPVYKRMGYEDVTRFHVYVSE